MVSLHVYNWLYQWGDKQDGICSWITGMATYLHDTLIFSLPLVKEAVFFCCYIHEGFGYKVTCEQIGLGLVNMRRNANSEWIVCFDIDLCSKKKDAAFASSSKPLNFHVYQDCAFSFLLARAVSNHLVRTSRLSQRQSGFSGSKSNLPSLYLEQQDHLAQFQGSSFFISFPYVLVGTNYAPTPWFLRLQSTQCPLALVLHLTTQAFLPALVCVPGTVEIRDFGIRFHVRPQPVAESEHWIWIKDV